VSFDVIAPLVSALQISMSFICSVIIQVATCLATSLFSKLAGGIIALLVVSMSLFAASAMRIAKQAHT
jgi:membrane protein YdbS with pleckstrin-like domain